MFEIPHPWWILHQSRYFQDSLVWRALRCWASWWFWFGPSTFLEWLHLDLLLGTASQAYCCCFDLNYSFIFCIMNILCILGVNWCNPLNQMFMLDFQKAHRSEMCTCQHVVLCLHVYVLLAIKCHFKGRKFEKKKTTCEHLLLIYIYIYIYIYIL